MIYSTLTKESVVMGATLSQLLGIGLSVECARISISVSLASKTTAITLPTLS